MTAFDAPDEEVLHTVGRPRPGTELTVRSTADGAALPAGESGEVCFRSPAVMAGYWRDPDATALALDGDGWLHTGDVGWIGDDGRLRLTGRIKEMYIRGGYNVYPVEVEDVLREHPRVALVAVIGVPDDMLGERGRAIVVANGDPPTLDDLRQWVCARIADYVLNLVRPVVFTFLHDCAAIAHLRLSDMIEMRVTADKRSVADFSLPLADIVRPNGDRLLWGVAS